MSLHSKAALLSSFTKRRLLEPVYQTCISVVLKMPTHISSGFHMYSHRNYEVNVKHHCNTFIKISPNVHFCTSVVSEKYIREKSGIYFVSWHLTFSKLKYTSYFCPLHKNAIHVFFPEQTSLIWLFVRRAGFCLFFHIQLMLKASWRHADPTMWLCVCSTQDKQTSLWVPEMQDY